MKSFIEFINEAKESNIPDQIADLLIKHIPEDNRKDLTNDHFDNIEGYIWCLYSVPADKKVGEAIYAGRTNIDVIMRTDTNSSKQRVEFGNGYLYFIQMNYDNGELISIDMDKDTMEAYKRKCNDK